MLEPIKIIEAALFSAGHPLSIDELKGTTELRESVIKDALKKLMKEYRERDTVLEVAQVGTKYAMQLRPEFAGYVQKIADMDIPTKVLKTAALIAYHQPIRQSDLFDMVGYRTYEHVKILHELGLIRRRDSGRTKIITTTERFSEYFGISTTDRDEIKKWIIEKLNLQIPASHTKQGDNERDEDGGGDKLNNDVRDEEGQEDNAGVRNGRTGEHADETDDISINDGEATTT